MILYLAFKEIEQTSIVLYCIYVLEVLRYEHRSLLRWCILVRKMVDYEVA